MKKNLFRKNAVLKAASPLELNKKMSIFNSREALALLVLGLAVIAMLTWGVFGVIYERVTGNGIVMLQSQFDTIQAPAGGVLISFDLATGDFVQRGQIVGRLFSFAALEDMRQRFQKLQMLQDNLKKVKERIDKLRSGQDKRFRKSKEVLEETIAHLDRELKWLGSFVKKTEEFSETGIVSKVKWNEDLERYHNKLKARSDYLLKRLDEENSQFETDLTLEKDIMNAEEKVKFALYELEQTRNKLDYNTRIVSNYSGTVTSVYYTPGSLVTAEAPLANLIDLDDQSDETWELYAYFPVAESKKIRPGMSAIVTPSSVKAERDGSIRGVVTHVGTYMQPVESINRIFRNAAFTEYLVKQCGSMPVEVRILLSRDRNSPNGFRWTSGAGPDIEISAGTLCFASVIVDEDPPLELVFSGMRKFIFGQGVSEEYWSKKARGASAREGGG